MTIPLIVLLLSSVFVGVSASKSAHQLRQCRNDVRILRTESHRDLLASMPPDIGEVR